MPIGVVIGPFSATPFALTDASVSSGSGVPAVLHHVDARLVDVPVERDAGRLEDAARRLGELGAGPVAGNEGHAWAIGGRIVALRPIADQVPLR